MYGEKRLSADHLWSLSNCRLCKVMMFDTLHCQLATITASTCHRLVVGHAEPQQTEAANQRHTVTRHRTTWYIADVYCSWSIQHFSYQPNESWFHPMWLLWHHFYAAILQPIFSVHYSGTWRLLFNGKVNGIYLWRKRSSLNTQVQMSWWHRLSDDVHDVCAPSACALKNWLKRFLWTILPR